MCMVSSILLNLDTLLDLTLEPGWNGDYEDFDRRKAEIETLQMLIEAERVVVFVPPFLVSIIHMQVKIYFGADQAQRVVRKILQLGNSHLSIDYERLLEQANTAVHYLADADLYDVMFLVCASHLNVDAIATYNPGFFHQLIAANKVTFSGFSVPILSVSALINLVSQAQVDYAIEEDSIYVLTPHNNVIKLAVGATPIDFAYSIHTRLGDRCVKALVNGREVPFNRRLKTGDVVEIIKDPAAHPDPTWLDFVVTRTARQGIQRGIKRVNIQQGWKQIKLTIGRNIRSYRSKLEQVAKLLNRGSVEDLVSLIGSGEMDLERLQELMQSCVVATVDEPSFCANLDLSVIGLAQRNCRIASCCTPLPGDVIVGVIGVSRQQVQVHRADCANIQDLAPEKLRPLEWSCDQCRIQLQLVLLDQPDTFRPILNKLVENSITPDLRSLNISDGTARATIWITIASRQHLDKVLSQISQLPNVLQVKLAKPIAILPGSVSF